MSKGSRAIQPIKCRDFKNVMKILGFELDRIRGSHCIYINAQNEMIVVPSGHKEINPMLWKVIQQRLLRNNLRTTQRFNER